jgi:DNA repair protein RadC
MRVAVHVGASSFVLVHNHPGGDARPSAQDIHLTESVAAASACVGIPLLDHVVVARGGRCSMLESGLFSPTLHGLTGPDSNGHDAHEHRRSAHG